MTEKQFLVSELFGPTIQGEGHLAGVPSHFLRFAGCPLRCVWCDSMHAVDPKRIKTESRSMTVEAILSELPTTGAEWITITGGDPVIWDLSDLIDSIPVNLKIAVETEGVLWRDWLEQCELVTCSPKPPSSGMVDRFSVKVMQKYWARLQDKLVLKVVIFDQQDLYFAERVHKILPKAQMYLSVGTPIASDMEDNRKAILDRYRWLVETSFQYSCFSNVRILPQLHTLIWGRELGR